MRFDKKPPLKSDKKAPPKSQKKGSIGYNKKSALLEDAITQMNAGKYGRASSALKDLLALDPLNAEARRLFATLHLRLGSLMSARAAFESLAREAMERQDYWLAESLLREYLTAGPRYVPFLEMLGRVYEDKGDVMAAVAEYGKAVEVLLEDPDAEKPDRPSELFARIRSIAPGSPVAFRFAAMFDPVTGQVLQATPPSPAAEASSAAPALEVVADSTGENSGLMPWEQMDAVQASPTSTESSSVAVAEPSPETLEVIAPPASSSETVLAMSQQEVSPDPPVPPQATVVKVKTASEGSAEETSAPGLIAAEPGELVAQEPMPVGDSNAVCEEMTAPASPVVDLPQPANDVQNEATQPAQAAAVPTAMPGDLVEEAAASIAPAATNLESSGAEDAVAAMPAPSSESVADLASPADPVRPALELLAHSESHPIAEVPKSPAPMPWDQVEEVAILIPPPTTAVPTAPADDAAVSAVEEETVSAPIEASTPPPTIELLTQTSSLPIAQAPTSPAPMPWDQVQDVTNLSAVTADSIHEPSIVEPTPPPMTDSTTTVEPAVAPASAEVTSSGLTWDEILAAVAAMQASPEPAAPLSEEVLAEPAASVTTDAPDGIGVTALSVDMLPPAPVDAGVPVPALSAPMPWEQVEVEQVTIPPQEPEVESSATMAASVEIEQESTPALVEPELSEPEVVTETAESHVVMAPTVDEPADAAPGFQLLSPDAPVESTRESMSVSSETQDSPRASAPDLSPASSPLSLSTHEPPAEPAFRLAEAAMLAPTEATVAHSAISEPISEFSLADSRPVVTAVSTPEAAMPVLAPVEATPVQEPVTPAPIDLLPEAAPSLLPEPVNEPVVAEVPEPMVEQPPAADEVAMTVVPEPASVPEQDVMLPPIVEHSPQEPTNEVIEEPIEHARLSPDSVQEPPADSEIEGTTAMTSVEESVPPPSPVESADIPALVLSADVTEMKAPDEPAAVSAEETSTPLSEVPSEPVADESVKILWDNAPSTPPAPASSGNMLTRWFKKSAEVVPADPATETEVAPPVESPAVPEVPILSELPVPVQEEVTIAPLEEPVFEPVAQVAADSVTELPQRATPSRSSGTSAWTRVGDTVASLVGAGVSTTRSMVVLALALVGFLLFFVGGTVAAVALTWLVLEEQPSAAYRTMTSVPQKMLQDSAKNGYFLLLGLGAPTAQDPMQAGIDRRPEEGDQALAHACLTGEGATAGGEYSASAEVGKWLKASDPAQQMAQNAGGVKALVSKHDVGLGRYRQWLSKPFEDEGYGQAISPNCGLILQTHRLYVADGFAQDVEAGMARLETDLTAWRTVLGQAKTMPMKLLAAAAMNDDLAVMGGLLQRPEFDERQISRIAKLTRPLEAPEQSLRWPMQSEFVLATKTVDQAISRDRSESRPFYGAMAAALPLPKQRRFNAYAEYYDVAGKAAAEGRFADLPKQSQFVHAPPYGVTDVVLNPIESLVGVDPLPAWETYSGRVLETEARLRLASLQAWLRRTPSEQDLLTRMAKAGQGLYDPFTGLPMLVNLKKGVLYSVGPDLKDNEAQERLDLVAQIPSIAWNGGKKGTDSDSSK